MKTMNIKLLLPAFFICFSSLLFAQDSGEPLPSEVVEGSVLSPNSIRDFRDTEKKPIKKDRKTLKNMYGDINFIDLRSAGLVTTISSGVDGDKNNFDSLSGYSAELTWEFPVLAKRFSGNTPILKFRTGKSELKMDTPNESISVSDKASEFVDTLGVSEVYTIGVGGGYCYHTGFNCVYGMYNTYLTGQLSTVKKSGEVSTVPTQLNGFTFGMTSTFDVSLGIEVTVGMEYSMLTHRTPLFDDQKINSLSLVFAMGMVSEPRYTYMDQIEYVE